MPQHSQTFEFSIGDRVILKEIQRPARVEILQVYGLGVQYRVCFWDNGKRETAWLYADEIEPRNKVDINPKA